MGAIKLMKRVAVLAALSILGACGQSGASGGQAGNKFAGLDNEILSWRQQIIAADPLCKGTAQDQKCQAFEVACKAERTVTPQDAAKGITARVVTAITWNGFDPQLKQIQAGSRTSEFTRGPSGWTRADHAPVNMSSCADL